MDYTRNIQPSSSCNSFDYVDYDQLSVGLAYIPPPPPPGPTHNHVRLKTARFHPYSHWPRHNPFPSPPEETPADKRRSAVNQKERRRNIAINDAFNHLQTLIPFTPQQKLAKIKTLNLATKYIQFLSACLQSPNQVKPTDKVNEFAREVVDEIQHKNCYTPRVEDFLNILERTSDSMKHEEPTTAAGSGEHQVWACYSEGR